MHTNNKIRIIPNAKKIGRIPVTLLMPPTINDNTGINKQAIELNIALALAIYSFSTCIIKLLYASTLPHPVVIPRRKLLPIKPTQTQNIFSIFANPTRIMLYPPKKMPVVNKIHLLENFL